ncbi:pirin family protein [Taibaiella koreensis]|uniref:pirin family protein n=1 Tax=Taibaiella koreensis TaxID=1268548 RepID=UPI000E59DC3D|nr:pirin family protein [Taibaiella koreensis]
MQKPVATQYGGTNARVGEMLVNRVMPNRYIEAVGPFVFLDHIYPYTLPQQPAAPDGAYAHPHRGIATFSYVFSGALEHYDSKGHHGKVTAGGAQWMKAGKGIVHDEFPGRGTAQENGIFHSLQFWINLPTVVKEEAPEYLNINDEAFTKVMLPSDAGTMKVLIGMCGDHASPVKTFSPQFLYHYRINPKSSYTLETRPGLEYAAFVPTQEVMINGIATGNSEIVSFGLEAGDIVISNPQITAADVMVFGGAPYTDPIVAEGPFVMTSRAGIATAYRDFFNGEYGTINYEQ